MSDAPLVGYVVGEVRTDAFSFVTNPELAPPRLEYVCVRGVQEPGGDGPRQVDLLAQVSSLGVSSRLLEAGRSYGEVEAILRRLGSSPPVMMAQAADGRWAAATTGREMPRQNGKGDEVEVPELWGLGQLSLIHI